MRVIFLTHYYPPEVGAPQMRIQALARSLEARGTQVLVHTGFPNYPAGALLDGYRNRPWSREQRDQIEVLRTAVYPAPNRGFSRRVLNHASFAASALATAPLAGPVDVVVVETPPLFLAAAGVVYARAKRSALVLHVADRWPASAVELGTLRSAPAIAAASTLERFAYRHADLVVAPTQGIVDALRDLPESAGRCRRVWPTVDTERFGSRPELVARTHDASTPLEIVYAGTVGLAQGVETLVDAARLAGPHVVRLTIAGDGAGASAVATRARGLGNVRLLGALGTEQVPTLLAGADGAVVLLRDLPLFRAALPTKLLEAMAAGRAVVLSAPSGEATSLVRETGAGVVVPPEDPGALADALRELQRRPELLSRLGAAGGRFADERLGLARSAEAWAALIQEAAERAGRRSARRIRQAAEDQE